MESAFDNYPDVFIDPNGNVMIGGTAGVVGTAPASGDGWVTLAFSTDGVNGWQAGFGPAGGALSWVAVPDAMRAVKSVNVFVSGQHFKPQKASGLLRNLVITAP